MTPTELETLAIKSRKGIVLGPYTILKEDYWSKEERGKDAIEGAANFRQVENLAVYGVAQPTYQGFKNVLWSVSEQVKNVVWINLREEPLIYLNGIPYVLRDQFLTLRNTNSYTGITSERLELLETKLKEDLLSELDIYHGKILLHSETSLGTVVPTWEDLRQDAILTLNAAMAVLGNEAQNIPIQNPEYAVPVSLTYYRVPTTSESIPEPSHFDHLISIISKVDLSSTGIILNCQIGLGRSTYGTGLSI